LGERDQRLEIEKDWVQLILIGQLLPKGNYGMQPESPNFVNLAKGLAALNQERATGELILSSGNLQWHLYLFLGRLLYASGGTHRVRRWYRAVKQECPDFKLEAYEKNRNKDELWEYQLLKLGIQQKQLTLSQARNIIVAIVQEVLFELVGYSGLDSCWLTRKTYPIALLDVKPSLQAALELKMRWRNMGLGHLSPNAVPIVKQPNFENFRVSKNFFGIVQLVNGENTIWDIAAQLKQSITTVGSHVQQLVSEEVLELSNISDLPSPIKAAKLSRFTIQIHQSEALTSTERTDKSPSTNHQPTPTQPLRRLEEPEDQSSANFIKNNNSMPIVSVSISAIEESYRQAPPTDRIPVSLLQNSLHPIPHNPHPFDTVPDEGDDYRQATTHLPSQQSDENHSSSHPFKTSIAPPTSQAESQAISPLIAHIDDSQSDSLKMGKILKEAGYRFINVQEAISALPILLESKPSLIFLDLVMPIANGYEICTQIRRISALKDTPVIILTSNDGILDRVRSKMAGSSGFLAKPITKEKILPILQKYLPSHHV
jgi:two-component system, chemotaxis family, response regulator PixG